MAVIYNQEKRIFSLQTKNTTYQMKADQEQDLEQYGYIRKFHEE